MRATSCLMQSKLLAPINPPRLRSASVGTLSSQFTFFPTIPIQSAPARHGMALPLGEKGRQWPPDAMTDGIHDMRWPDP